MRVANREGSPPWGGRKRAGDGFRKSKEGGEGKRRRRRKKKKERENISGRGRKKKEMRRWNARSERRKGGARG